MSTRIRAHLRCLRSQLLLILILLPCARTTQADPEDEASDGGQKSSELVPPGKVLERLFGPSSNYDPHAFPTGAGTPVKVTFKVKFYGIDDISMANNQFTLTMKHYYQYRDDRLAITENIRGGRIYLDSEKYSGKLLWNPRVVFSNLEKVVSEKTASDILYASELAQKRGFNVRPAKLTEVRFNSAINVRKFPFDVQQLKVIVSSFSYTTKEVDFSFAKPAISDLTNSLGSGRLTCTEQDLHNCINITDLTASESSHGGQASYSRAEFSISLQRIIGPAILNYIVPLQGIWLICYMSFFLDPTGNVDRSALTITALLTMVAYGLEIKPKLPEAGYVTLAEVYIFFYLLVCLYASLEYLVVVIYFSEDSEYNTIDESLMNHEETSRLVGKDKATEEKKQAVTLDRFSRCFVPGITLVFNIGVTAFVLYS